MSDRMKDLQDKQTIELLLATHYPEHKFNGSFRASGENLIVAVTGGIVIFPPWMSYKRFINNTWYE